MVCKGVSSCHAGQGGSAGGGSGRGSATASAGDGGAVQQVVVAVGAVQQVAIALLDVGSYKE